MMAPEPRSLPDLYVATHARLCDAIGGLSEIKTRAAMYVEPGKEAERLAQIEARARAILDGLMGRTEDAKEAA